MRLTFIIGTLGPGGAERVMTNMANYWSKKGWEVTFLLLDQNAGKPAYPLHENVDVRYLRIVSSFGNIFQLPLRLLRRLRRLRENILKTEPDAVISFLDENNILALLASRGMGIPVIVSERSDPHHSPLKASWNLLRRITYPMASRVTAQTSHALEYFPPGIRNKGVVIPNPVILYENSGEDCQQGKADKSVKTIIAMGRLVELKGYDKLIKVFSTIAHSYPEWNLRIYGEGELRGELERLISDLGLLERIQLPGRTNKPNCVMRAADLFVLSSRYEGFPNVLCEAMACGLPGISFDCESGPRDIIRDGVDGVLVPPGDIIALSEAMARLMGDGEERKRLAARAPEVLERFEEEKVMGMWEELIT